MENIAVAPSASKLSPLVQTVQNFIKSYDREFQGWIEELKFHENLKTEVEKICANGEKVLKEVTELSKYLEKDDKPAENKSIEVMETVQLRWKPHFDDIRRLVAQLMASKNYRGRACWTQLRDKATYMIMLLEEMERNLNGFQSPEVSKTTIEKVRVKKGLSALLAEEVFTACEADQYDAIHLKLQHFMIQDEAHEDTLLVNQIRGMLKNLVGGDKKQPYRSMSEFGFVSLLSFREISDTLQPMRKVFEEGIERHGQKGLPAISYPHVDLTGRATQNRIVFSRLQRNLDTVQKVISHIRHDVSRKQALAIYYEPLCFLIREVRLASENLFHDDGEKEDSPVLVAMRKLIPIVIRSLKELSGRIAVAEGE